MKSNYDLLKSRYPDAYKKIKSTKIDSCKYELINIKEEMYTLKINEEEQFYLHSKYNPVREAEKFIEDNYNIEFNNYIVIGLGFGYHIKELLKKDNVYVTIIECNLSIFKIALESVDLIDILGNSRVTLYIGETLTNFKKSFDKAAELFNYGLILHSPSIKAIPSEMKDIKYLLEEFKVKAQSIKNISYDLDGNFEYNKSNYDDLVNTLFNKYKDKTIVLVSAGPSLDKNKHLLGEIGEGAIILCVGRAVRVLLKEEIKPDIIVITDPSQGLYEMQLEGLEIDVPIIILSTCDKNVIKNYKGKKYIALQNGFDKAEAYSNELGVETVETGGSVATTALDIAIRMGGNPIVFVGQDLAFSGGQTHSSETLSKDIKETSGLRLVKDIEGKEVYTSKNLSIYLRWIENRIRQEKDIEFIDATEGGAKIEGTKVMDLKDVLRKI